MSKRDGPAGAPPPRGPAHKEKLADSTTIAHPVPEEAGDLEHASTIAPRALRLSARLQRGIDLAEERFEEIEKIASWTWRVPSVSRDPQFYVVDLKQARCASPDYPPEGERRKHVSAAAYKKAKTATCSGCRKRFRHRQLYEVQDWYESLTWFEGGLLCEGCACDSGVL